MTFWYWYSLVHIAVSAQPWTCYTMPDIGSSALSSYLNRNLFCSKIWFNVENVKWKVLSVWNFGRAPMCLGQSIYWTLTLKNQITKLVKVCRELKRCIVCNFIMKTNIVPSSSFEFMLVTKKKKKKNGTSWGWAGPSSSQVRSSR